MTRARTLVGLRRGVQRLVHRGLAAAARATGEPEGEPAGASVEGSGAAPAPEGRPDPTIKGRAGRYREGMRMTALLLLVEAVQGRELARGENAVTRAVELAGALQRAPVTAGGVVESLREAALRRLLAVHLGRQVEPGEYTIGLALDMAAELIRRREEAGRHVG